MACRALLLAVCRGEVHSDQLERCANGALDRERGIVQASTHEHGRDGDASSSTASTLGAERGNDVAQPSTSAAHQQSAAAAEVALSSLARALESPAESLDLASEPRHIHDEPHADAHRER
jgi:hypothetical protein